jgi:hypothetical protein
MTSNCPIVVVLVTLTTLTILINPSTSNVPIVVLVT